MSDAHNHSHTHDHSHAGHSHAPANFGKAFLIGITLNSLFVIIEMVYGYRANSVALIADAGHNVSDVLGLAAAWFATYLARRKPTVRHTYGLLSSSILAALANATFLLIVTGGIVWEAVQRLAHPQQVSEHIVMAVAAIGIAVNGITAWLFMKGSKGDLNIRGAFLHMASDAAVSLGVVIAGGVILYTGLLWIDPIVSIIIALVITYSTWGLLRDSVNLSLHAVPANIDPVKVKDMLSQTAGVHSVHDLHIWAMSTTDVALTAHLVMKDGHPGDAFIKELAHQLEHDFGINHSTFQIELGDGITECALAPDNVV